jgi:hypothetical protein
LFGGEGDLVKEAKELVMFSRKLDKKGMNEVFMSFPQKVILAVGFCP